MPKKAIRITIFIGILIIGMMMIFLFSMQTASESDVLSSSLAKEIIDLLINKRHIHLTPLELSRMYHWGDKLLRMAAHFGLFTLFSMELGIAFVFLRWNRPKPIDYACIIFMGGAVAFMDEGIKLFVDGRHFEVLDSVLDIFGAFAGLICIYAFIGFFSWLFGRHSSSKTQNSKGLNDSASDEVPCESDK